MIAASSNWNYVAAGYAISAGALVTYAVWVRLRVRKLKRTLLENSD